MICRHCNTPLTEEFINLGSAPPSNAYLSLERLNGVERWFPLRVLVCTECWLVQTQDFANADELFQPDYAYFSSFSRSWLEHCESYVDVVSQRYGLGSESHVVELAANDGYLLQFFAAKKIPCTGVEPTASTAMAARAKGLDIVEEFFGRVLAEKLVAESRAADLIVANNVLAHVPDINDFAEGCRRLLKLDGVATFEFPHLLRLIESTQFDTIYHEHFSYLSLIAVSRIFQAAGLTVFEVEKLGTHGGSLRVHAKRDDSRAHPVQQSVAHLIAEEHTAGLAELATFRRFQAAAEHVKDELLRFLLQAKKDGKSVAAYGAAAKGNTLLNFSGVRSDLISWVVDRNPHKAGSFLPGSRIPIVGEELLKEARPDYVVVLPWNLMNEISEQLKYVHDWGGKLVSVIPQIRIV